MDSKTQDQILELAITAPSGDNCQPHTYKWKNNILEVFHNHELAENRKYNFNNMGSALGFGCVIGIIETAAKDLGYKINTQLTSEFGQNTNPSSPWAKIEFTQVDNFKVSAETFEATKNNIKKRHVNRENYNKGYISKDLTNEITKNLNFKEENLDLNFINFDDLGPGIKKDLFNDLSYSDTLVFKDPIMFEDVSKWVHLSYKKAQQTKDGLCWNQIGLKAFELPFFALLKSSANLTSFLYKNAIGKAFRDKSSQLFKTSAGVYIIWGKNPDQFKDLISTGKLAVQLWIKFNSLNWAAQPLTSMSAFGSYLIKTKNENLIDLESIEKIKDGQKILRKLCGKESDQWPIWMFRVGECPPLSQKKRSFRRDISTFIRK